VLFFGNQLCRWFGLAQPPAALRAMQENQLQVFMGLFVLSSIAQNLQATGAFEIRVNDKLVFSKLETGKMPSLDEVVHLLEGAGIERSGHGGMRFAEGSI